MAQAQATAKKPTSQPIRPKVLASSADFKKYYNLHEELGRGSYGVVFRCTDINTHEEFGVKVIDKSRATASQLNDLQQEVALMSQLKHDKLVNLYDVMQTQNTMFLILELVRGKDLFHAIQSLQFYNERCAATLLFNFLTAMAFLHSEGVVHRDLKPENLLMAHCLPQGVVDPQNDPKHMYILTDIKVADFGFAERCGQDQNMTKCCGTPYFIAPEVLNAGLYRTGPPYGLQCDMWSVGVISYILLCGFPPFHHNKRDSLFRLIANGQFSYPRKTVWDQISDVAKDFVSKCLVVDVAKRLTARQALQHPFILKHSAQSVTPLPDVQLSLKEFNARYKIRGAVFGIEAVYRLLYLNRCREFGIKPNSKLVEDMTTVEGSNENTVLDLSSNYLGKKGIFAVCDLISRKTRLTTLLLQGNNIDLEETEALVRVLVNHPSVTRINLSNNPLSRQAAKRLIYLIQTNRRIIDIELQNTQIHLHKLTIIKQLLQANLSMKANRPVSDTDDVKPHI